MNSRPLIRYHGGKWKLAEWIIAHMPSHRVYVEPFGGGASVLLRKPRSYAEIYNDLDGEIVNLFRMTRDQGEKLRQALELTPFSRDEYEQAWYDAACPLEQARRTLIRAYMGFGSAAVTMARHTNTSRGGRPGTGFRSNSNRSGTTPAHDWRNYPEAFVKIIDRLRGVVIENRDATEVMLAHDGDETLHYVDPPYVSSTRDKGSNYRYELTDSDHEGLARTLYGLKGIVLLSGYHSKLYDRLYQGWTKVERHAMADGARARVEVLWTSPNAALNQMRLFA